MNEIIARRVVDGARKLALRIPAGALKGAGVALAAAMAEEGRMVSGGASVPWRFESIVQDEEGALLLGPDPFEDGPGAASLDEAPSLEQGLPRLLAMARAFSALHTEGALPRGIVSTGILLAEGGEALVLPPSSVAKALAASGPETRAAAVARLASHRAVGPESDASFLLAQAAYRFAAGSGAFAREAAESGGVAGSAPVPIGLAAPRLDPTLAAFIDGALANPGAARLRDWIAILSAAQAAGWTRELPAEEEAGLLKRRDELEARTRASLGRAAFFRKRGGVLIAAAAAIAVLALVGGDMLRAQRDKPDYSWLTPRELVQRYYMAIESLDMDSLEACGEKKAVKSDQTYLMNLTVITKTRMAYEGKSPIVRAVDWIAAGKPALSASDFLYGIAGLSISAEPSSAGRGSDGGPAVSLRAEYSFWTLARKDDPSGDPGKATSAPLEERRIDELRLERGKKGGWKIVGLERSAQ